MLDDTPHVAPPKDRSENEWVNFGVGEAGQVAKANADKRGTRHIVTTCEENYAEMIKAIQKKFRPKFLGIF